jgi:membrane fusion protein (multidrug efflux system)
VFRRHMFLFVALIAIGLMVLAGVGRLLLKPAAGGQAAAGGPPAGGPPAAGGQRRPGGPGGGPRATPVNVASVKLYGFSNRIEVLGAAKARQSITLTAPTTQLVTKINFQSGQFVRQGQVLAELNAREQDANILQSEAQADFAKKTYDRWKALADRGVAPAATADQYKSAYDQALATVAANRARAGDRIIRAPFSGVVGLSDAAPGMLVNPGSTIATLDDVTVIRVDFPVAERYLSLLHEGVPITADTDAYSDKTFAGRIAKIDTRIDSATRSVMARAEFDNSDGRLKPGMLMHVVIDQEARDSPAAPEGGVAYEGQKAFVFVITPDPAKGRIAVRREVKIGARRDGLIEVTEGLKPGEQVVADGLNRIRPNDAVSIAAPPGAGRPGRPGRPPGPAA